jgi:hypothetical protein
LLHRDLLFAAACVGDSVNVAPVLRQEIASRLLSIYCDRRHAGRYRLLQNQVKEALLTLCNDQGDTAVEAALAATLTGCPDRTALTCALEAVDWLNARTPAMAHALAACSDPSVLPRSQELLRAVQARLPVNGNGRRPAPSGWDAVHEDPALARLLGTMWRYGWQNAVEQGLRVANQALREIAAEAGGPGLRGILGRLYDIGRRFEDPVISRDSMTELNNEELRCLVYELRQRADEMPEPLWRELRRELGMVAFGYSPGMPPEELTYRIRRLLDRLDFDRLRYAAPELASTIPAEILARFEFLERRLRDLEDTSEASNIARRELARFAQELEFHARESYAPGLRAAARELERLSDGLERTSGPVDVGAVLLRAREALEGGTGSEALPEQLPRWGGLILRNAQRGGILASLFAARAARLIPLQPLPDEDALHASVQAIQADLADALLDTLRRTADAQRYNDTALFLAYTGEGKPRDDAVAIVLADLEGADAVRRRLTLQVLAESAFREHVQFTDARRALLLSLLDAPADQATPALDILLTLGLTPDLLARCWTVLRHADHPLTDVVSEKLDRVMEIKGERPFLVMLDEGRRDAALRAVSLELLRKVSWQGAETFAQALMWLADEDAEVRHLAALLLADQDDLLAVPRNVLARASQEKLKASDASWAALRDDAPLVRLLGGMWLHGWDEVLTQLWVAQPAVAYVDKHPHEYWRSFRTYPESEECIRWLLEKAAFGQTLIPTFRRAAASLNALENEAAQGAPEAEHIATVQQEISQQMDTLLAQPDTPPLLAVEAAILAAAARQEAIPPVSAATLQATLQRADDRDWAAALARLGQQSELYPWLRILVTAESDLPLAAWLRQTLAAHGLRPNAPPAALAGLLTAKNADTRLVASLALLATDLPALLVEALMEAAQSLDDRVRMKGISRLYSVCGKLATDGSTEGVQSLLRFNRDAEAAKDGYLGTVSISAVGSVEHTQPFWVAR